MLSRTHCLDQGARLIGFENEWMNVVLAARRRPIAQTFGDGFDGADHIVFDFFFGGTWTANRQLNRRVNGSMPRPEVLGGDVLARNFAEIIVHHGGIYRFRFARVIQILKQFEAGQVATTRDDRCKPPVVDFEIGHLAALTAESEPAAASLYLHVLISHSGKSVRTVLSRILFVAHSYVRQIHDPDHGSQYLFFRKPRKG